MQPEHVNSEDQSADALTKVIQTDALGSTTSTTECPTIYTLDLSGCCPLATQNEGGVEWDIHFWYITFLRRSRTRKRKGHAFTHCLTRGFT